MTERTNFSARHSVFLRIRFSSGNLSPQQKSDMYWLDLKYSHDRLKVQVMFGDEVIVGANAYIKGESELDFVKAISYAAHMCYKFAEQTTLEK